MRSTPLPPLVPRMTMQDREGQRRPKVLGPQYRAPLPLPIAPPPTRSDIAFGMSRLTNGGRLANQNILNRLVWTTVTRLAFTIRGGLIVVTADPAGTKKLDSRSHLLVPITVLRSCGLHGNEPILMAALLRHQRLILHPPGVLARLTDTAHTAALDGAR